MDINVNGKLFPLWVMKNFKEYKLPDILRKPGLDPCNVSEKKELNKYQTFFGDLIGNLPKQNEMLVYHGLGSGKTAGLINLINVMFNISPDFNVIILIKASLKSNWMEEMNKWLHRNPNDLNKKATELKIFSHIHFVNYDSPFADKDFMELIKKLDMRKNNVFVVEEAHNFIRNVYSNINSSEGKKAYNIYEFIQREKKDKPDTKIVLLTGTPLINVPFELALMFNLLRPGIFPPNETEFEQMFVTTSTYQILNPVNKNLFQRRIMGLVTYYLGATPDKFAKEVSHTVDLRMTDYQLSVYETLERLEEEMAIKSKFRSKLYKTYTRQACNFVFPYINENVTAELRPRPGKFKITEKMIDKYEKGHVEKANKNIDLVAYLNSLNVYIQTLKKYFEDISKEEDHLIMKDLDRFKKFYTENKDIELGKLFKKFYKSVGVTPRSQLLEEMYRCSPKMTAIVFYTSISEGPVLIYSNYVIMEGLDILKIYLELIGFNSYGVAEPGKGYGEFTGVIDKDQRERLRKEFNREENTHGKIVKVFLLSPSGSEGLNLFYVRQVHILEPYWTEVRIQQIKGRGIRQCSHSMLPFDERVVDVFRYKVLKPKKSEGRLKVTTDEIIENNAKNKDSLNESFLNAMKEVAVDCELFKSHNMINRQYQCFEFNEKSYFSKLSAPAFKQDIKDDMRYEDGLNSSTSSVQKIRVIKIKATLKIGDGPTSGYSEPNVYLYNPKTGVVYDLELHYPVGKVTITNGLPEKLNQDVYIMSDQIVIPGKK